MNWAIVTWAGSIGVLLAHPEYKEFVFLTVFIPLLFWIVGARWSFFQQGFIFRQNKQNRVVVLKPNPRLPDRSGNCRIRIGRSEKYGIGFSK
jgi:hypothetical protein